MTQYSPPQPPPWRPGPRPVSYPAPVRIEPIAGEPFGLAILPAPGTTSGVSIGSMIAGVGSILVAGVVWCFGLLGADDGWGGLVAGAFCVLAAFLGAGGLALGGAALRQIRRNPSMKGHGLAITGMISCAVGVLLAIAGVIVAIALARGGTSAA